MTAINDRLATALEQLAAELASIQRHRRPVEAPEELTNAYVAFVFAAASRGSGGAIGLRSWRPRR